MFYTIPEKHDLLRGLKGGKHESSAKKRMGPKFFVRPHIDWGGERIILYKGVNFSLAEAF